MTIFDVLTMIGGLCLFLFGMNIMGDSLERRAGSSLNAHQALHRMKEGNGEFRDKRDRYAAKYSV